MHWKWIRQKIKSKSEDFFTYKYLVRFSFQTTLTETSWLIYLPSFAFLKSQGWRHWDTVSSHCGIWYMLNIVQIEWATYARQIPLNSVVKLNHPIPAMFHLPPVQYYTILNKNNSNDTWVEVSLKDCRTCIQSYSRHTKAVACAYLSRKHEPTVYVYYSCNYSSSGPRVHYKENPPKLYWLKDYIHAYD